MDKEAMENQINLEKELHAWAIRLCQCAGEDASAGEVLWEQIKGVSSIYKEFAYYFEHQEFLCEFSVNGFTTADILVWQMDHFRAHMDRADSANRYDKDKLLLSTFRTMLAMNQDPIAIQRAYKEETGIDLSGGWHLH